MYANMSVYHVGTGYDTVSAEAIEGIRSPALELKWL